MTLALLTKRRSAGTTLPAFKVYDITRHQGGGGDGLGPTVTRDPSGRGGHYPQRRQRALRAEFLHKADDGIEQDDRQDHIGVGNVADESGDQRGGDQYQYHEVGELIQQHACRPALFSLGDDIVAMSRMALPHLLGGQTGFRIRFQASQTVLRRELMPQDGGVGGG